MRRQAGLEKQSLENALHVAEAQVAGQAAELAKRIAQTEEALSALEERKAACASLQGALRTAETHRGQLLGESQELRAQLEKLQQESDRQRAERIALEDALRAAEAARVQLSERRSMERGQLVEFEREKDQYRNERDRLRGLLAETASRYQALLKQRSDNFQQLLRNAVARAQQDAEAQMRMLADQHREERESLEQLLKEAEARQQQMDEQAMAERRRLESALSEAQAQNRRLMEYGIVATAVTSLDGSLLTCSEAFARMFGYSGCTAALAHPGDWQSRFLTDHAALEMRLKSEGRLANAESCVRSSNGVLVWVMENSMIVPGRTPGSAVVERMFLDVTERHLLKEELRRCRRTESVGRLAAATVQTFNDLVTSMSGYSQLLIEGLSEDDPRRRNAERIQKVALQASSLARQLLAYSRRQERPPDLLDLNAVVGKMEDLLRTLIGEDIEFSMTLAPDLGLVSADRSDLEQAITAFVVNGRDSLPLGGALSIETANVTVDTAEAGRLPEPYVLLSVTASGYGVQPIACPPSIDAIVARYGGHLRTANEPEKTAVLRIYLPRVEPTDPTSDPATQSGAQLEED